MGKKSSDMVLAVLLLLLLGVCCCWFAGVVVVLGRREIGWRSLALGWKARGRLACQMSSWVVSWSQRAWRVGRSGFGEAR